METAHNEDDTSPAEEREPQAFQEILLRNQELQRENERLKQLLGDDPERDRLLRFLDRKPDRIIRDILYESMLLPKEVSAIIDTPEFLRLDKIRQLTFVYLVWPGATHTRREHSLGVYHLTKQALIALMRTDDTGVMRAMTEEDLNTVLAAALLHDVGHYPFSHAIEELGDPPIKPHEAVAEEVILHSAIAEILVSRWGVNPQRVTNLITGEKVEGIDNLLHRLLSGTLDTDKMDYLVRDSRRCNVGYGRVDVARLLDSLTVRNKPPDPLALAINRKGVGSLQSLIHARRSMFDIVYGHHVNNIATAMLLRCVQDLLEMKLLQAEELLKQDDASLVALVKRCSEDNCPSSYALIEGIEKRQLYKRGLIITQQTTHPLFRELDALYEQPTQRKDVEVALAQELSARTGRAIRSHEVLVHIPRPIPYEVDIQIYYASKARPLGYREFMDWDKATGLNADDLEKYQSYARRMLVVGTPEVCEILRGLQKEGNAEGVLRKAMRNAKRMRSGSG